MKIADETTDLKRGIDHIGIGICCLVHDGNGNFLMMKRGEKARDEQGRWDIVGGAIEFGEDIEDAVHREIMEEISTVPLDIQFVKAYQAHRIHQGMPTHWVQLMHLVKVDPATVKIGEPHKIAEIGWFTSKNLPQPQHSQFFHVLDYIDQSELIQ